MAGNDPSPVKEIGRSLESALTFLTSGRYAELGEQALAMEHQLGTLEELKQRLEAGEPAPEGIREDCERLRRKTFLLSEVLRHATLVEAGLLEIEAAVRGSYSREWRHGTGNHPRLNAEA